MLKYVLKRILIFIPTLIVVSLMIFGLSKVAPGDPVELRMSGGLQTGDTGQASDKQQGEKVYFEIAREMGLDLPSFYADFTSRAYPDTMYKVGRRYEKEMLGRLCSKFGNWPQISTYYKSLKVFELSSYNIPKTEQTFDQLLNARATTNELYREHNEDVILVKLNNIKNSVSQTQTYDEVVINENGESDTTAVTKNLLQPLIANIDGVINNFTAVQQNAKPINKFIPKITWHGLKNQYHRWLFGDIPWFGKSDDPTLASYGFLRGDFGYSLRDGRPVWSVLKEGLAITVSMNLIAIFLIYAIAIPLGVYIAVKRDSLFDRVSTVTLFILYSLPTFWIATMLLVFFTNSEYGMDFFPSFGLGLDKITPETSFFSKLRTLSYHAFLPILCMTYSGLAFLSRQMRGGVINVFSQDYIRTARAKGLAESKIIWKHTFRNSLIPIITIFASLLPGMIGGSLIIEYIFSIPGMGNIAFGALLGRNWPVLFTVVMLSSILTLLGILVSDILYSVVDPRITFTKKA